MYNKPTSGQQSVAKFKILILMNTVKVVAELELLLDRLYLPALNLLRRRIRMEWLTRAWNRSILNPPLPSFMSTQEVSIKAMKLKNSQPGRSYKMMQWYSALLTFSFIKEGTSKKGVAIFDATGTDLQQTFVWMSKNFVINTAM